MIKQKLRIFIDPLSDVTKKPVDLVTISSLLDFLSSRFEIESIDIQLNERARPSQFYFDFLSGLCKGASKKINIDDYVGSKKPNVFKLDSFSSLNLIINNEGRFTTIFENEKKSYGTCEELTEELSKN
jgi:hypothetical protein